MNCIKKTCLESILLTLAVFAILLEGSWTITVFLLQMVQDPTRSQ